MRAPLLLISPHQKDTAVFPGRGPPSPFDSSSSDHLMTDMCNGAYRSIVAQYLYHHRAALHDFYPSPTSGMGVHWSNLRQPYRQPSPIDFSCTAVVETFPLGHRISLQLAQWRLSESGSLVAKPPHAHGHPKVCQLLPLLCLSIHRGRVSESSRTGYINGQHCMNGPFVLSLHHCLRLPASK